MQDISLGALECSLLQDIRSLVIVIFFVLVISLLLTFWYLFKN